MASEAVAIVIKYIYNILNFFISLLLFILGFANSNGLKRRKSSSISKKRSSNSRSRRISIRRRIIIRIRSTSIIRRTKRRRRRRRRHRRRRRRIHISWCFVIIFLVLIICYLNPFKMGSS